MNTQDVARRYCVVIQLSAESDLARIARDMPEILSVLQRFSDTPPHVAFRSSDGVLSGFFIRTNRPVAMIRSELDSSEGTTSRDAFMIFEIGEEFSGNAGLASSCTWLQRH